MHVNRRERSQPYAMIRKQVPFLGGYAFTDYKTQGKECSHVIVDVGNAGVMDPSIPYVLGHDHLMG